jgi:SH3 domain protein
MRYALVLGIFLIMLPTTLLAETLYVSEVREITLRTGPGAEYKITSMIQSGTPMTVIDAGEDWTQVQLSDGKEGWVLTQYLQSKIPDAIQLERLQKKHAALTDEASTLKTQNAALSDQVATLTTDLESCRQQYAALTGNYENLKTDSADFLTLQSDHKKIKKELATEKEKTDKLEDELNDKRLTWIIAGASILLIGIILGIVLKPQRRRSSLM